MEDAREDGGFLSRSGVCSDMMCAVVIIGFAAGGSSMASRAGDGGWEGKRRAYVHSTM